MKKIFKILVVLTLILSFTACSKQSKVNSIKSTEVVTENLNKKNDSKNKKLEVYTSFYPLYDFAVKVGGDKVHVTNLVPAGTEPHDWEPATTDILSLEKGDILIYNGVGMEHWIDQVTSSLENESLILVEASKGLTLLEGKAEDGEKENSEEITADPHVWLSIRNAKKEMETIKDTFVKADPDNAAYYEDNFNKNAADFETLDTKFKDELSALTNKDIVVAHQAFAYLCADYGLNQIAIEGLAADSEPDAKRMAEIIDFARSKKIKTIFFEELVSPKVAEAIASEIGAKTEVLNPLEGLTQEQINAGEDYLSIMDKNLEVLVSALK
ncbi:metal ABC transporter substrate-binding protein [Anaerocolumna sp. MB42-C2]|uniref:metal ABC transporter substrate-binding protein n=1 Tax=Anaerocolumna sp. MB42-C2 TaxID=3070997 RepID=UPI0027E16D51|nr:metal ABC transporter substrate-binding protein [Anaerocolumna sp. MB42-C2]WMJ86493.1 metal ABC transporter substrate-binding protein [Anaerocolumna sp. MB42-C2]